MCFEYGALPPDLPADLVIRGGASAEVGSYASADGTRVAAGFAPVDGPAPAVIVLPDARGLYPFYVELAERFAAAGFHSVALDYFGRTAGAEVRGEDFDYMAELARTTPEQVQTDIAGAREALAERAEITAAVTVGFCFGGAQSFLAGGHPELGLDGVVGFYGTLDPSRFGAGMDFMPAPLRNVASTRLPVLGLFGGADGFIPQEDIDAFDEALDETGVDHEIVVYPGAPHSFFDRTASEHADACKDAWRRIVGFVEERSKAPA